MKPTDFPGLHARYGAGRPVAAPAGSQPHEPEPHAALAPPGDDDRARMIRAMRSYLETLAGEEILYFPTPGDAGDSLLQVGTYQALKRAGIRFRPISLEDDVSGRIVMLGGGSNLTPLYRELRHALLDGGFLQNCRRLVILPHTLRGNEDLLARMDDRVTIFCRDPESYVHVLRHAETPHVHLDHDMALHLDVGEFYEEARPYTDTPELFETNLARYGRRFLADEPVDRAFYRVDGERQNGPVPPDNVDISMIFQFGTWPENSYKAVWCFLEAIRRSRSLSTDRLHVAIGASLLDRPCRLDADRYGKNAGVYLHSLRKYAAPALLRFVPAPPV